DQSRCATLRTLSCSSHSSPFYFFFFNDPPPTEIYTLSLHDALPISDRRSPAPGLGGVPRANALIPRSLPRRGPRGACLSSRDSRSEEHTSELQSLTNLVCRLLLEKKKNNKISN